MGRFWLLLIFSLFLSASELRAEYFVIRSYNVEVEITEEGYAEFREVIRVEFSEPRHGIYRDIPLKSRINGETVKRIIQNVEVEGHKKKTSTNNGNFRIRIGDPDAYVDGFVTYVIKYRVLNPLNFYEQNIEFYWDLLGTSWPVPTDRFLFSVTLPNRISLEQSDVLVFSGEKGNSGTDANFEVSGSRIEGSSLHGFNAGEALTIAVNLPVDSFEPMSAWEKTRKTHGLLFAPLIFLFAGGWATWKARNKKLTIMPEYFPPEDVSPCIAGGFVDHRVDTSDVLCLLPQLAIKGYLQIETEEGGFWSKDKVYFTKLKELDGSESEFEKMFYEALFSYGDRVRLKDLKNKFYVHIGEIRNAVRKWIDKQGWYESSQRNMGCLVAIGGVAAIAWGMYALIAKENLDGIALLVTGVVLFILTTQFNKRTPTGNEAYLRFAGFREFVKKAEKPVIERLLKDDPNYYDKTMPYALAFGYLKNWNQQFEGLLSEPPRWYYGHGHAAAGMESWNQFSDNFSSEIDDISSVFTSSPSSSSSGGGSSGGGSGGGGGGSW